MPAENFPKIKQDFKTYEKFRKRKKRTTANRLNLEQEKAKNGQSARRRCVGELSIQAGLPNGECRIAANISIDNRKDYQARIFADYFGEHPCLRFCSSGRHHMNRERGKGLPDRPVPAPHFHKVDACGVMRAYRTSTLVKNEKLIKNIESGIRLFCQESNIISPDGTPVMVKLNAGEMDLSTDDPFQNVRF